MRERAHTVIVGSGIVGASAAWHLAELGQPDVLVVDKGPLFETGGSTSNASGLVFQTKSCARPAGSQDTVALYERLGEGAGSASRPVAITPSSGVSPSAAGRAMRHRRVAGLAVTIEGRWTAGQGTAHSLPQPGPSTAATCMSDVRVSL